jgi:lambda family phage minor tail protein L
MSLSADIQKLEPGAIVELFELDLTQFGVGILRFHAGTNGLIQSVVWQGNSYTPFPIQATGFEINAQGQAPRPRLAVSNVAGAITALVLQFDDIVGAKLTRRRTLVKYLDAVNFPAGNPSADPDAEFALDIFYVDRKGSESNDFVEFELAPAFDLTNVMIPKRQIIQNMCAWKYKGAECGYTGTNYFDINDNPTTQGLDRCGKRLTSCKIRFGEFNELPFGGFPSAGLLR